MTREIAARAAGGAVRPAPASGGLELRGLSARGGAFVLGPLELSLPAGGYGCIVGPSGAGKSTLLAAIAGLIASEGEVLLGGEAVRGPPEERGLSWVPQGGQLFPHLDVEGNVAFGARARTDVAAALEAVQGAHLARRRVSTLSGGEAMRVALARALARRPRLLLLDEPLASIDPAGREPLRELLASIPARSGAPVLHVTHDFDEACALGSHLGVLIGGRLRGWGPPQELLARPPSEEVASFLALDNVLAGSLAPGQGVSTFTCGALVLQVAGEHHGEGVVTFDGAAITLARTHGGDSARNAVPVTVRALEPLARGVRVRLDASGVPLVARVTAISASELGLAPGADLLAVVKATALHVIRRQVR